MRRRLAVAATLASGAALAYSLWLVGMPGIRDGAARVGWGFLAVLALSGLREAARALAWTRTTESAVPLRMGEAFLARLASRSRSSTRIATTSVLATAPDRPRVRGRQRPTRRPLKPDGRRTQAAGGKQS